MMKKKTILTIFAAAFLMSCSCNSDKSGTTPDPEPGPEPQPEQPGATAYVTKADKTKLFVSEHIDFGAPASMSPNVVRFTDDTYQGVDGFGAAMTVASCWNILKMPEEARTKFRRTVWEAPSSAYA